MAVTIGPITLPRSSDELLDTTDGYGASAKIWLATSATGDNWSATALGAGWSNVTSETIVSGVEAVYFRHAAGTSTSYYTTWVSKSDGTEPSLYSAVFQVGSLVGYTTVAEAKAYLQVADTADDSWLPFVVNAVNAEMTRRIGAFIGPSDDALRIYSGTDGVVNGYRLWVPGGIRTLTQVRTRSTWGGDWTTRTLTDYALAPRPHGNDGHPYSRVEVNPGATGFECGTDDIELTGTFGFAAVPADLAALAQALVQRVWNVRDGGGMGTTDVWSWRRYISPEDQEMLSHYRFSWVEAGIG